MNYVQKLCYKKLRRTAGLFVLVWYISDYLTVDSVIHARCLCTRA